MESTVRKPFQGIKNIVKFNWHFYVIASIAILLLALSYPFLGGFFRLLALLLCISIFLTTATSLLVSAYVYDLSGLYNFSWMSDFEDSDTQRIVNINAGFDETSALIEQKFPLSELVVLDFYNEQVHTEPSIKRARKTYPSHPKTKTVSTTNLGLDSEFADLVFLIFSAHEIRNEEERVLFLKEVGSVLKSDGEIILVEHLQDLPNFLAYNIGFLHFHSLKTWETAFEKSNLEVFSKQKLNPFVSKIILRKNGNPS